MLCQLENNSNSSSLSFRKELWPILIPSKSISRSLLLLILLLFPECCDPKMKSLFSKFDHIGWRFFLNQYLCLWCHQYLSQVKSTLLNLNGILRGIQASDHVHSFFHVFRDLKLVVGNETTSWKWLRQRKWWRPHWYEWWRQWCFFWVFPSSRKRIGVCSQLFLELCWYGTYCFPSAARSSVMLQAGWGLLSNILPQVCFFFDFFFSSSRFVIV